MFNKLKIITNKNHYTLIIIVFFGSIGAAILEILSISFIPIFAALIMDPILLQSTFKKYIDLKFIETISPKDLLFWGGTTNIDIYN